VAHKKAGGSTSLGRDSQSKRLGVKLYAGQKANAGNVLIRQRGTLYGAGKNVRRGSDDTLYAAKAGTIQFQKKQLRRFDGQLKLKTIVNVV
jgi:large subunit ribosomal protein L27